MPAERDAGFTLLEVLIALVIAAIGLAAMFQGTLGGVLAADSSGRMQEAVARARSRLATIGVAAPLVAGDSNGDDGGGYRWRVRVVPVASGGPGLPALYAVSVAVSWGGRAVTLETRRLGVGQAAPP